MDIKKRLLLLLLCFISIVPSIAQRDHIDISIISYVLTLMQNLPLGVTA